MLARQSDVSAPRGCTQPSRLCRRRCGFLPRSRRQCSMQLRHLKTFVAVASTLNITRAGEEVHLAQSSVTEQIQSLEADLGTPLFDRSRRRLRLTEAGRRLLEYAGDILSLSDEAHSAVADAAGLVAGSLAVGGLETLCANRLPPLLAKFRQQHPAIALQMKAAGSGELRS